VELQFTTGEESGLAPDVVFGRSALERFSFAISLKLRTLRYAESF